MERFRCINSHGDAHQWNFGQYFSKFDLWRAFLFVKSLDYQSGSFALCIGELDDWPQGKIEKWEDGLSIKKLEIRLSSKRKNSFFHPGHIWPYIFVFGTVVTFIVKTFGLII